MGAGPICILALLFIALPVALLVSLFRLISRLVRAWLCWRAVPLQQKNHTRAGAGAAFVVLSIGLAAAGFPIIGREVGMYAAGGVAAFGLLWFCVGVAGSQGARRDWMSVFWWGAAALGCGGLLLLVEGFL